MEELKKMHPYWLPLPISETTELYCKDCAKSVISDSLREGNILWEYVCEDNPESDLEGLIPQSQFGIPIESDTPEWCEKCGVDLNVCVVQP